jgi:hypothetical protein
MAGRTVWVLADQLSHGNPALAGADRVLLVESEAKLRSARFHRQKLHLVLAAMRHFARELEERGVAVEYRRARSPWRLYHPCGGKGAMDSPRGRLPAPPHPAAVGRHAAAQTDDHTASSHGTTAATQSSGRATWR